MANGCEENCFSKFANALLSLFLLLRISQFLLKTVENGVLYISHILSKNNIEVGDLDVTMSRSVSCARESWSIGKQSHHLIVEDMTEVINSASSYLNCLCSIVYSRGKARLGRYWEEWNVAPPPFCIDDRTSVASLSIHSFGL